MHSSQPPPHALPHITTRADALQGCSCQPAAPDRSLLHFLRAVVHVPTALFASLLHDHVRAMRRGLLQLFPHAPHVSPVTSITGPIPVVHACAEPPSSSGSTSGGGMGSPAGGSPHAEAFDVDRELDALTETEVVEQRVSGLLQSLLTGACVGAPPLCSWRSRPPASHARLSRSCPSNPEPAFELAEHRSCFTARHLSSAA